MTNYIAVGTRQTTQINGEYKATMQKVSEMPSFDFLMQYKPDFIEIDDSLTKEQAQELKRTQAKYYIGGKLTEINETTALRNNDSVINRDILILDYDFDEGEMDHEQFKNIIETTLAKVNYLAYPTFNADENNVRYRVAIELNRAANKQEYEKTVDFIANQVLKLKNDNTSKTWSQMQGLPVRNKYNQKLPFYMNTGKSPMYVIDAEPKEEPIQLNVTEQGSYTDEQVDKIIKNYINTDLESLKDYNNALSCIMVLAKAVQTKEISQAAAESAVYQIALGERKWEIENVNKLRREIRNKNINTKYSFYEKFVKVVKANDILIESELEELLSKVNIEEFTINDLKPELEPQLKDDIKEKLYMNTSPSKQIDALKRHIAENKGKTAISTGFPTLDQVLDGGLYNELYFLGAISSLGKTTLLLQMADQIAKSGQSDVMIFTLEMSRFEIMTKSLSRITHELSIEDDRETYYLSDGKGKTVYNARTVREITDSRRYDGFTDAYGVEHKPYTDYQKGLIERAYEKYAEFADKIYIHENTAIRGVKVSDIEKAINNHIEITGKPPVIILDYLQILTPEGQGDIRMEIDQSVRALKNISVKYKVPVISISSFNRQNYNSGVSMASFKESGAVEYSSDTLIGLQFQRQNEIDARNALKKGNERKENLDHDKEKSKVPRKIEFKILKQRNGMPSASVAFDYYSAFNHYIDKGIMSKDAFTVDYSHIKDKKGNEVLTQEQLDSMVSK